MKVSSMSNIEDLLNHLNVEKLDTNLFRGTTYPLPLVRVFGGQVLAQCLNAATRTVEPDSIAHSLHGYFLRPGIFEKPIIFEVDPIRDGKSFNTRRVVAKQNGKAIFNCAISFQQADDLLNFQDEAPTDLPDPESLIDFQDYSQEQEKSLPADVRPTLLFPKDLIEIKAVNPETEDGFWFRFNIDKDAPAIVHQTLFAFISDWGPLGKVMKNHGLAGDPKIQCVSLDHAIWIHSTMNMSDWFYFQVKSPRAAGARVLTQGTYFDANGNLFASTTQEGLIRKAPLA